MKIECRVYSFWWPPHESTVKTLDRWLFDYVESFGLGLRPNNRTSPSIKYFPVATPLKWRDHTILIVWWVLNSNSGRERESIMRMLRLFWALIGAYAVVDLKIKTIRIKLFFPDSDLNRNPILTPFPDPSFSSDQQLAHNRTLKSRLWAHCWLEGEGMVLEGENGALPIKSAYTTTKDHFSPKKWNHSVEFCDTLWSSPWKRAHYCFLLKTRHLLVFN